MNIEKFTQLYTELYTAKIEDNKRIIEHPYFQKIYDLTNLSADYGYNLFYSVHPNYHSFQLNIDYVCELFNHICHAIEDDGDMSFVCAYRTIDMPILKKIKGDKYSPIIIPAIFIMDGWRHDHTLEDVGKIALTHGPHDAIVKDWIACRFDENVIDFLHSLIPEFNRIKELANVCNGNDGSEYYKATKDIDAKMENYIKSRDDVRKGI